MDTPKSITRTSLCTGTPLRDASLSIFQFAADSSDWMFLLQFFVSPNIDGEASFELDELDSNSNHPEFKFI